MELAWRSALLCQTNTSSQQPEPLAFPQVSGDISIALLPSLHFGAREGNSAIPQFRNSKSWAARAGPGRGQEGQRGGSVTIAGGSRELLNVWLVTK